MDFPLSGYLDDMTKALQIIPSSRHLTKEEITFFNQEAIRVLQTFFWFTFPERFNRENYQCLRLILNLVRNVERVLPSDSLIIAPGDSPYKVVQLIKWLYPEKNFRFVEFPLSYLRRSYSKEALDDYLEKVFSEIELKNLVYLDHVERGYTYMAILESLRRISRNPNLGMIQVNLDNYQKDQHYCQSYKEMIIDAEDLEVRCVPSYNVSTGVIKTNNIVRCNLLTSILYLLATNKIRRNLNLPSVGNLDNLNQEYLDLTYFEIATNEVVARRIKVNAVYENTIYVLGLVNKITLKNYEILKGTLIHAEIVDYFPVTDLGSYENSFIHATLVNGYYFIGWFNSVTFDIGCGQPKSIPKEFFQSIERVNNPYQPVDISPYQGKICQLTHLCENKLTIENFYLGKEGLIPEEDFVTEQNSQYYQIDPHLIYQVKIIKMTPTFKFVSGLWRKEDDYYSNGKIYVIRPLVY